MERIRKIAALLALALFTHAAAMAQQDPRAREILDKVAAKYKDVGAFRADVKMTLEDPAQDLEEDRNIRVAVKGDKYRYKLGTQEIYNDARHVWTHDADLMEVIKSEAEEGGFKPTDLFNVYKSGFKYRLAGEETAEGVPCYVVDLEPESREETQFFKQRFFIAKKDYTVVSYVQFERRTGRRYRYRISEFETVKLPDSYFTFDAAEHPDADVIDLTEGE